ncbi:hypothetical protein [Actibacterium sp. MT2.3-13A]|uniref:hypothetical protein n=1 Tax=Actibacterium sp. MT2.3-13A TaxID=2828332 RepID=UPI001BA541F4|nr:hypothetical protein [Actibacterium sp. MT2.3-13A]
MKAIAEYFRNLAADDRYFGAEPPTPDAEMLQRIAEREIRKRVEAHIGEEGIVLRAAGAQAGLPPAAAPAPAEPASEPPAAAVEPAGAPAAEAPLPPAGTAETESVAAKLARIRAVVDHARAAPPALHAGYAEDEEAETEVYDSAVALPETEAEDEAAAFEAQPAEEDVTEETFAEDEEAVDDTPILTSISRKLRAAPEPAAPVGEAAEDEDEFEAYEAYGEEEAALEESAEDDILAGAAPDATMEEATFDATLRLEEEAELTVSVSEEQPEAAWDEAEEEAAAEEPETRAQAPEDEAAETAAKVGEEDRFGEKFGARATAPEVAQDAASRARARVLRIKRADLEGGPAAVPAEAAEPAQPASDLSPEDEADLMAELAEVEREAERAGRRQGRARLQSSDLEEEETAVSRLIATTNTKLEGPEHRRRRTAIAHLKAAVAATVAERRLSRGRDEQAEEAAEMAPYRQDLAKVVRPRRPERRGNEEGQKMAPLMLVSEQRIDRPTAAPSAPVRPQRVARGNLALQAHDEEEAEAEGEIALRAAGSFADYAEERGARGLSELLEAAGAYLSEVEGLDSFSRPQAMRLVDATSEADISREDRLRAFGRLLREGKFERIKRGQFTISNASRFHSGRRA